MRFKYTESDYYLSFSCAPGIGPKRFQQILKKFGSAQRAFKASKQEYEEIEIKKKTYHKFDKFRNQFDIQKYKEQLAKENVEFIAQCDERYPQSLKQLDDSPIGLFAKGNVSLLNCHSVPIARPEASRRDTESMFDNKLNNKIPHPSNAKATAGRQVRDDTQTNDRVRNDMNAVAVVGTRKTTSYGRQVTESLVSSLTTYGFTIVSGLALGIDAIAHKTALDCQGPTLAVLGCGVDCCYPRENQGLYNNIIDKGGLIISEYPLGTPPTKGSFPARNRIIAALSQGILVTEAGADSGSLITADYGLKLGKKIFAVPGPITSRQSDGTSYLLKNGAKLVQNVQDIIDHLQPTTDHIKNDKRKIDIESLNLNKEEKEVLKCLESEGLQVDELSKKLKIPISQLSIIISSLEMQGFIKSHSNGILNITYD